MLGSIIGDIVGSRFEFINNKSEDFELFTKECKFTDDTVMCVATMDSILNNKPFDVRYHYWGNKYPNIGYGSKFNDWLNQAKPVPYRSFGNGSAMRVSPVGWAYNNFNDVIKQAKLSASVTHNHREGVRGACAVAVCVYLARSKTPKNIIKDMIEFYFQYNLSRPLSEIKPTYKFNETCQGSVPEAITCFLEGNSYEDIIRKAVGLGGDADTLACIAGGIAEAYYGIPQGIIDKLSDYISSKDIEIASIVQEFYYKFVGYN